MSAGAVRRSSLWAVGAVIVIASAAAGFFIERSLRRPTQTLTEAPKPAATAAPAAAATAATAPAGKPLPDRLPDFELRDRDGKPRQLSHWAGRPLLVNFWATWCPPCRREIPLLNRMRTAHAGQKLEIVGIAVDFRDDVLAYASKQPIDYPLLIGEEDGAAAVQAFGMQPAFPFSVFADSQHRIVAVKIGELHEDDITFMLEAVAQVDAGTLDLKDAQESIAKGLQRLAIKRGSQTS